MASLCGPFKTHPRQHSRNRRAKGGLILTHTHVNMLQAFLQRLARRLPRRGGRIGRMPLVSGVPLLCAALLWMDEINFAPPEKP